MPSRPTLSTFDVDTGTFVHIDGRPGTQLACGAGCLWITRDGSPLDMELAAGQRWVITETGRLIVNGFGPSVVQIVRQQQQPAWRAVPPMLHRWLSSLRTAVAKPATGAG